MKTDLFISYAWTSEAHREWVRLLASQLHLIGYNIKIDEDVDYGSSLSGFMKDVTKATHVLLIIDENYVERANNQPYSGVGIESKWISEAFTSKPAKWLSVLFVRNPDCKLPEWLKEYNPRGFDFNSLPIKNEFPGAVQIDAIWRWIEDLAADKTHAVPLSVVHKRAARLERVDVLADPGNYVNPALDGRVTFCYKEHPQYTIGNSEYQFKIKFSGCTSDRVYLYTDAGLKAVGLITSQEIALDTVESFLTQGRTITPKVGQRAILMNTDGALCILTIDGVQDEVNENEYIPGHVTFTYQVLKNS